MEKQDFITWAAKLQQGYIPNATVLQKLKNIDLIAIVGPTGVGKTTIINKLHIPYVQSDVTRQPREGEQNGKEYFFRSDYFDILDQIKGGEYVQFLVAHSGEFYGTLATRYPESGAAAMAIVASEIPHFRSLGFRKVLPIYILPPGYVEWMHRIGKGRATDFSARMQEAGESLPLALKDSSYHFVLNDDLDTAVQEVKTIITGGSISEHRKKLARDSADMLYGRLGLQDEIYW